MKSGEPIMDTTNHTPPTGDDKPKLSDRKVKITGKQMLTFVGLPLVAFILGMAAGGDSSDEPAAAPEPEVRTETKTVTEEVEVPVTPQACYDALDSAESIVSGTMADVMTTVSEAFESASVLDAAGMEAAMTELDELTVQIENQVAEYNPAAAECRST